MTPELVNFIYWIGWFSGTAVTLGVGLIVLAFWLRKGGE